MSAGHHACASCSWSGVTVGARGQPGLADEHDQVVRQPHERLAADALGGDRPLLVQLARERGERALALVDRAAGAERPAPGPGRQPGGAAAGQPAALAVARRRTARRSTADASPSTRRSAQRSGCNSSCSRRPRSRSPTSRAPMPSWLGEPRSRRAAIAASAAPTLRRRRSKASSRQTARTWSASQGPRASSAGACACVIDVEGYAGGVLERSPADVYAEHCRRRELAYQVDDDGRPVFRPRVGPERVARQRGPAGRSTRRRSRGRVGGERGLQHRAGRSRRGLSDDEHGRGRGAGGRRGRRARAVGVARRRRRRRAVPVFALTPAMRACDDSRRDRVAIVRRRRGADGQGAAGPAGGRRHGRGGAARRWPTRG